MGALSEQTLVVVAEEVSMKENLKGGLDRGDPLDGGGGDATGASFF